MIGRVCLLVGSLVRSLTRGHWPEVGQVNLSRSGHLALAHWSAGTGLCGESVSTQRYFHCQ